MECCNKHNSKSIKSFVPPKTTHTHTTTIEPHGGGYYYYCCGGRRRRRRRRNRERMSSHANLHQAHCGGGGDSQD